MSSTTVEVCEPTGSQCPGMASSQVAVRAAQSAPNDASTVLRVAEPRFPKGLNQRAIETRQGVSEFPSQEFRQ